MANEAFDQPSTAGMAGQEKEYYTRKIVAEFPDRATDSSLLYGNPKLEFLRLVNEGLIEDTGSGGSSYTGVKMRPKKPNIIFEEVTDPVRKPMSIGSDGFIYGGRVDGSNMPIRSSDGFATVDTSSKSFSSQGDSKEIRAVYKVAEGFIAVTAQSSSLDTGTVWFTPKWDAPAWKRTLDLGFAMPISIGRPTPKKDGSGTVFLIGEYGNADTRNLYLSEDGGQTFRIIYVHKRKPGANDNNAHIHHASYDPETGRIWLSCGDGPSNWFGYSDDMGYSWVPVPAMGAGPEDVGTIFNHPTVLTPTSKMIVTTPDGARGGIGVWTVDKKTGRVKIAHEAAMTEPYRAWARAPWAQNGDEIYIMFPPDEAAGEIEELIVCGTGDGGESWYTLARIPIQKSVDFFYSGMIGPDKQGRLWMYGKRNNVHTLLVGQIPGWEEVGVSATLENERGTGVIARAPLTGIENSSVETILGTFNLPAKLLKDGDVVRIKTTGTILNNSGSNADFIFKVRVRDIEGLSTGNISLAAGATPRRWSLEIDLHVVNGFFKSITGKFTVGRPTSASMGVGESLEGVGWKAINETTNTKTPVQIRATSVTASPEITISPMTAVAEYVRLI